VQRRRPDAALEAAPVPIPAGIDEGHQIRLSGEGEVGPAAGHPAVSTSPSTSRPPAAHAAKGPSCTTRPRPLHRPGDARDDGHRPDRGGEEEIEIKAGTQPGTEIRLRGRGVPHLRRAGQRGDLHVLVDVAVPTKLSKKQRELLERFAAESGEQVGTGGILDKVRDVLG
jgi:molecular chaperone DnaJ